MSEVVPEDEDRGGDGAMGGALDTASADADSSPGASGADDEAGGTGPDDGGPGSQNM